MQELIKRYLAALSSDPKGHIMWRMDKLLQDISSYFHTIESRLLAHLWGVDLGSSCRFYGITKFKRSPDSKISIGARCLFRSAFISNMVGLNRVCGISTHKKNASITIGEECGFSGTIIAASNSIAIGNRVSCGGNVTITDFDWHNIDPTTRSQGGSKSAPIIIGNNVWLGLNCLVLKGCTIGDNTVIGANSVVVSSSVPANVVAAGNPARVIRPLQNNQLKD